MKNKHIIVLAVVVTLCCVYFFVFGKFIFGIKKNDLLDGLYCVGQLGLFTVYHVMMFTLV